MGVHLSVDHCVDKLCYAKPQPKAAVLRDLFVLVSECEHQTDNEKEHEGDKEDVVSDCLVEIASWL
jgi:hypothetical protein